MSMLTLLEKLGYSHGLGFQDYLEGDETVLPRTDNLLKERKSVLDCNGQHVGWMDEVFEDPVWQTMLCRISFKPTFSQMRATLYYPEEFILYYKKDWVLLSHSLDEILETLEKGEADDFIICEETFLVA